MSGTPWGESPWASQRIVDGPTVRESFPPMARSIVGQPQEQHSRSHLTLAFSCGARSAFNRAGKDYLRSMLSRRKLQGFVVLRPGKHAHLSQHHPHQFKFNDRHFLQLCAPLSPTGARHRWQVPSALVRCMTMNFAPMSGNCLRLRILNPSTRCSLRKSEHNSSRTSFNTSSDK